MQNVLRICLNSHRRFYYSIINNNYYFNNYLFAHRFISNYRQQRRPLTFQTPFSPSFSMAVEIDHLKDTIMLSENDTTGLDSTKILSSTSESSSDTATLTTTTTTIPTINNKNTNDDALEEKDIAQDHYLNDDSSPSEPKAFPDMEVDASAQSSSSSSASAAATYFHTYSFNTSENESSETSSTYISFELTTNDNHVQFDQQTDTAYHSTNNHHLWIPAIYSVPEGEDPLSTGSNSALNGHDNGVDVHMGVKEEQEFSISTATTTTTTMADYEGTEISETTTTTSTAVTSSSTESTPGIVTPPPSPDQIGNLVPGHCFDLRVASSCVPKISRADLPPLVKEDCGEDAYFLSNLSKYYCLGLGDGVGGWGSWGVDPSLFAWDLMTQCQLVSETMTHPDPQQIMEQGYQLVIDRKQVAAGSSTACVVVFDKQNGCLRVSNLGDSGLMVFRQERNEDEEEIDEDIMEEDDILDERNGGKRLQDSFSESSDLSSDDESGDMARRNRPGKGALSSSDDDEEIENAGGDSRRKRRGHRRSSKSASPASDASSSSSGSGSGYGSQLLPPTTFGYEYDNMHYYHPPQNNNHHHHHQPIVNKYVPIFSTTERQHYFNAPYQLSILPESMRSDKTNIMDSPADAIQSGTVLHMGDVFVLASDGLWDNMYWEEVVAIIERELGDVRESVKWLLKHQQQRLKKSEQSDKDEGATVVKVNGFMDVDMNENDVKSGGVGSTDTITPPSSGSPSRKSSPTPGSKSETFSQHQKRQSNSANSMEVTPPTTISNDITTLSSSSSSSPAASDDEDVVEEAYTPPSVPGSSPPPSPSRAPVSMLRPAVTISPTIKPLSINEPTQRTRSSSTSSSSSTSTTSSKPHELEHEHDELADFETSSEFSDIHTNASFDPESFLHVLDHRVQKCAQALTEEAAIFAKHPRRLSPFARSARMNGRMFIGGKVDDITVVVGVVAMLPVVKEVTISQV